MGGLAMLNRRTFIASGAALAGLGLARPALAQGKAIRIGYVSPQTGPLSAFSAADAFMVRQFLAAAPGLGIEAEVIVKDSQSNPNRAAEVARELISRDEVNLLLVASTPETTNPVCSVAESEEIPVISTVAPGRPDPRRRAAHALIELSGRALDPAGNTPKPQAGVPLSGMRPVALRFSGRGGMPMQLAPVPPQHGFRVRPRGASASRPQAVRVPSTQISSASTSPCDVQQCSVEAS
ncbi:amino acid/amide ABC transporter substrate-binding protein, HAAT family (plasmid) [Paracoccus denitrificans PD1222]|uniref:Amino acid/amide ABC transporter substrate-binding protein, HAAT family n=2 Tax=Paracoccus denitrificans TaxID=266 RepID=A1BBN5_PARDP|nr:amino acid/amide ABC transporter substrate-binding protein, HAAT family [Paracoccus denitrificans PD1222]